MTWQRSPRVLPHMPLPILGRRPERTRRDLSHGGIELGRSITPRLSMRRESINDALRRRLCIQSSWSAQRSVHAVADKQEDAVGNGGAVALYPAVGSTQWREVLFLFVLSLLQDMVPVVEPVLIGFFQVLNLHEGTGQQVPIAVQVSIHDDVVALS